MYKHNYTNYLFIITLYVIGTGSLKYKQFVETIWL